MITLKGISKTFNKGGPNEATVLHDISLEIKKNDFIIVVGSNGSGKSTLLNIISGNISQDKGTIHFEEKEVSGMKDYKRSRWISRIFQNPLAGTAPDLTILENFRLASLRTKNKGLIIGTGEKFKARVRERISILNMGLENKLGLEMGRLSGGQRQALALLMAIMDETKVILLDEPAAALDPKTSVLIMDLAARVIRDFDLSAILVTHQLKDVINYGNRVLQMNQGQIIRDLNKESMEPLTVNDVYEWFS